MIKKIILVAVAILLSHTAFSQENVLLKGKIVSDSILDSSVHIINLTQKTGTSNRPDGSFEINVREDDVLLFSSILYLNKEVTITKDVLTRPFLAVSLVEDVNELPEVNVSSTTLTGNLNTDVSNIEVVKGMPLNINLSQINKRFEADLNDPVAAPEHLALKENAISTGAGSVDIIGGLGLLANLIGIKEKPVKKGSFVNSGPASKQIRSLFRDEFFINSLGIQEESIQDFLFYLDDVQLNSELMKQGNQMALIEVLFDHSKKYKEIRTKD